MSSEESKPRPPDVLTQAAAIVGFDPHTIRGLLDAYPFEAATCLTPLLARVVKDAASIAALVAKVAELKGVVDRLHVTRDRVPIVQGMTVFRKTRSTGRIEPHEVEIDPRAVNEEIGINWQATDCYSTGAAALAAVVPVPTTETVFVFGSNRQGRHGKGAALHAVQHFCAIYGQAEGRQGNAYAIVTKELRSSATPVTLDEVAQGVDRFIVYARENTGVHFQVTAIGCGLAGFKVSEIAPLFIGRVPDNVTLPIEFEAPVPTTHEAKEG